MHRRHARNVRGRTLVRIGRRLQTVLDAGRRRHVADVRFYQLLTEADEETTRNGRLPRLANPL